MEWPFWKLYAPTFNSSCDLLNLSKGPMKLWTGTQKSGFKDVVAVLLCCSGSPCMSRFTLPKTFQRTFSIFFQETRHSPRQIKKMGKRVVQPQSGKWNPILKAQGTGTEDMGGFYSLEELDPLGSSDDLDLKKGGKKKQK